MRESSESEHTIQQQRELAVRTVLDFIDQTTAVISAVEVYSQYSGTFAADYISEQVSDLENDLPLINRVITELGGIEVDFVDKLNGKRKTGHIMGFANLNTRTMLWDLALMENKDKKKIVPVQLSAAELRDAALNFTHG